MRTELLESFSTNKKAWVNVNDVFDIRFHQLEINIATDLSTFYFCFVEMYAKCVQVKNSKSKTNSYLFTKREDCSPNSGMLCPELS